MSIKQALRDAYSQKRNVKIKYYSLSSDEIRWRTISIYSLEKDFLIAFCHLRGEERTFVIDRIRSAKPQEDKYNIPEGWTPESIVWTARRKSK